MYTECHQVQNQTLMLLVHSLDETYLLLFLFHFVVLSL